nr:hypothetical protein [Tanacetum cinerariifolium]
LAQVGEFGVGHREKKQKTGSARGAGRPPGARAAPRRGGPQRQPTAVRGRPGAARNPAFFAPAR